LSNVAAQDTSKIIESTGARVEIGFWDAINNLLLRIPDLVGFAFLIALGW
jgi:hypothetical protein